jgi:2-iminobutanoate/2-iminopropanoate deaminase
VAHGIRAIATDGAPQPVGPYSQAVAAGGFVFCAGQIPLDPRTGKLVEGPIDVQTTRVLENVKAVLEAAGSGLDQVVKTSVFLADLADFGAMNEVYARYFSADPKPARTTIQAAALPARARVEIEVVAVAPAL